LLSHTSGLPEDLPRGTLRYEDRNPLSVILEAFMNVPPKYRPGEKLIYSNIGYGIIGRVVEALSGSGYREFVWRTILGPLWMNDSWFGKPPPHIEGSVAIVEGTDRPGTDLDPYNGAYFQSLGHGWGGMFATAGDIANLAQLFLDNGKPLLDVGTGLAAIRNWTNGLPGGFERWPAFPTGDWGLGWEIKGARGKHWTGALTSHITFGHIGHSGCFIWADPMLDLICVLLTNRTTSNGWPIAGPHDRWLAFSEAVVSSIMDR
jgi:CubicO group peptidase (beta-lactamase class C family)